MIECLESRVLLTTGPTVTAVSLNGTPTAVTSVVLHFDEPLNPATADNTAAYAFGKPPPAQSSSSSGISLGDIFGFRYPNQHEATSAKPKLVKNGKIQMASAVYDPTADTVTLTPLAPFKAHAYFRFLRVKGTGADAIEDTSGNELNGGNDIIARWTIRSGKIIHFHDPQHDHVTLHLTGPGQLMVFTANSKKTDAVIFVEGGTSASTLSGLVTNNKVILPQVTIDEIAGVDGINDDLVNTPMFNVLATAP